MKTDNQIKLDRAGGHMALSVNTMVELCHGLALDSGWHEIPRENGTALMLIVSEVSEAMEGDRKNLNDDHLPHRKMTEVELADVVIRTFDFAGKMGFDLGGAIIEKLKYNQIRADHKPENRNKEGGKSY